MRPAGERTEVVPGTVTPVLEALREAARTCTEVGWNLTTHTPLMPPGFFQACRGELESLAGRLHMLALDLEVTALQEGWRLSRIEAAGDVELRALLAQLVGDIGWGGRLAWTRLSDERGLDLAADPLGRTIHSALGVADVVSSMWHSAAVLAQGTPLYGVNRPGGAAARQELVAMGITLTRMSLPWILLEPEDAGQAFVATGNRVADGQDLQSGDLFRWGGHITASIALGAMVKAASATDAAAGSTWAGAARGSYDGVSQANKVPPSGDRRTRTAAGARIRQVEDGVARFMETEIP